MYKINDIISVIVTSIKEYGIFVKTDTNYTGLIHISEINGKYIKDINKIFKIDTMIKAKIIGIDEDNRHLNLSTKGIINNRNEKRNSLVEAGDGFEKLKNKLPKWIDEAKKEIEKNK